MGWCGIIRWRRNILTDAVWALSAKSRFPFDSPRYSRGFAQGWLPRLRRSDDNPLLDKEQSADYAVVDASDLREGVEQILLQAIGGDVVENLRSELFGGVAGVFGGGEPARVSADDEAEDVLDGAAEFGGVIEDGGVFFVQHSGGGAAPEAVA